MKNQKTIAKLTKKQQAACMALAYDARGYVYEISMRRDTRCMIAPPRMPAFAPWWCDHRALLGLRGKGLLNVADAGGGNWRGTLNKLGQEIVTIIVGRNPSWLTDFPMAFDRDNAHRFLDKLMLPPGPYRSMAAVLRDAQPEPVDCVVLLSRRAP